MPEMEIIPHPEEERPLHELREEFRAEHLQDIRSQFAGKHPVGWNMIGEPSTARDRYTAEEWRGQMLKRMDESVTQDFGLGKCPERLGEKMEELAKLSIIHAAATWDDSVSGVSDHDSPACLSVTEMTDDQLCDYVQRSIEDSKNG